MTLQARLIYRTDERLDARCTHHFPLPAGATLRATGVRRLLLATEDSLGAHALDGTVIWSAKVRDATDYGAEFLADDRLLLVCATEISLRDGSGQVVFATPIEFESLDEWVVSPDRARLLVCFDETWLATFDLTTGAELSRWDMAEDYEFGRHGVDFNGMALLGDRAFFVNAREITEWVGGGLERMTYRPGDNVPRWGTSSLVVVGDVLVEGGADESRGLVAIDAASLGLVRQRAVDVDGMLVVDGRVFGWSAGYVAIWDPRTGDLVLRGTDWAEHQRVSLTRDGAYAVSISPGGEICVFDVGTMPLLDEMPESIPGSHELAHVEALPNGQSVVLVTDNGEGARFTVLDAQGQTRTFARTVPYGLRDLRAVDERTVCSVDDNYGDVTEVVLWQIDDLTTRDHEFADFFDIGPGWLRQSLGDEERGLMLFEFPDLGNGTAVELPPELTVVSPLAHPRRVVASDGENEVLYDFADGVILDAEAGQLGGRLYLVEGWNDDYDTIITLWDLANGESQEFESETSATWVSGRHSAVFFDDYDGAMFVWRPGEDPVKFAELEDSHDFQLSRDEEWLYCRLDRDVLIFSAAAPGEPIARVTFPFGPHRVHCDRGFVVAGGHGGMVAAYVLE